MKHRYISRFNLHLLVNSLVSQEFQSFIKWAYKDREEQLIWRKSLKVDALPEFAKLFKSSQSISRKNNNIQR